MGKVQYNSGNYNKYISKNFLKRKMVERFNSKVLDILDKYIISEDRNPLKILDAGCGEGFITSLIYDNIGNVEITGLEYTKEALEIAMESNKNIVYIQGDICKMPFEAGSFDIVICMEVLEHLSDPCKAIEELLRVTKDLLIITVPNEPWFCLGNIVALKNIIHLGNPIDHINHWTFRGFKRFLSKYLKQGIVYETSFPWSIAYCNMKNV